MLIILVSFNSLNSDNVQKEGIWQQRAMHPTGLSPLWLSSLRFCMLAKPIHIQRILKKNSRDRCPECEDGNIAKNRGLMCTLQMFQKNAALGVQRSRWGLPREMLILWDDESFPTIYHPCPQAKSLKPGRFHFFSPWSGQFNSAGVLLQQPSWLGTFCIPFGHWGLVTTLSTLLLFFAVYFHPNFDPWWLRYSFTGKGWQHTNQARNVCIF